MQLQDFFPIDDTIAGNLRKVGKAPLVVDEAIELVRSPLIYAKGWTTKETSVHIIDSVWRLGPEFNWLRKNWLTKHQNEISRKKLALRQWRVGKEDKTNVEFLLEATEWSEVRAFQEGIAQDETNGLFAQAFPFLFDLSTNPFPNIAVIHVVAETADAKLMISERGRGMHYHPLHWSTSFEEGLEPDDAHYGNDLFHVTAARGFREEFHFEEGINVRNISLLAVIGEYRNLNPAIVAFAKVPYYEEEIRTRWMQGTEKQGVAEVESIEFIPFNVDSLARLILSPVYQHFQGNESKAPWHPTSRYRILMAMLYRFGENDTISVLSDLGRHKRV